MLMNTYSHPCLHSDSAHSQSVPFLLVLLSSLWTWVEEWFICMVPKLLRHFSGESGSSPVVDWLQGCWKLSYRGDKKFERMFVFWVSLKPFLGGRQTTIKTITNKKQQ